MKPKPRINVAVDEDLHRKVKTKAAEKNKTITEIVVNLLKGWVKK